MNAYLFTSALREFMRPKRVAIWVFVAAVLGVIAYFLPQLMGQAAKQDAYLQMSSVLVFRLMALASAVFSMAVVAQEIEQKTIVYVLTRPIERWRVILFRLLASIVVVFLIGVLFVVASSVGIYGSQGLTQRFLLPDIKTLALGTAAYGGLFVFTSLLLNRALIICLLFAFGWETSIPNMPGYLYYASIYSHLSSVAQHPSASGPSALGALSGQLRVSELTPSTSLPVLLVLIAVTIAASCWWFTRFEYTPREDAE